MSLALDAVVLGNCFIMMFWRSVVTFSIGIMIT
jgi:hypothetical protein